MKERPILFQGDMVRAILDGRKTQTRRARSLDKVNRSPGCYYFGGFVSLGSDLDLHAVFVERSSDEKEIIKSPYGKSGDHLWVREAFITGYLYDENDIPTDKEFIRYRADPNENFRWIGEDGYPAEKTPWKPSIHMPRWASRITLEITDVRVERLQDISDEDAIAEGARVFNEDDANLYYSFISGIDDWPTGWELNPVEAFKDLWMKINGLFSWNKNPWVWVIEFKRVDV